MSTVTAFAVCLQCSDMNSSTAVILI